MFFKTGDFVQLANKHVFEVVYADEKKAVCLFLHGGKKRGYFYSDHTAVIANEVRYYKNAHWLKKIPKIDNINELSWEPLETQLNYTIGQQTLWTDFDFSNKTLKRTKRIKECIRNYMQ